MARYRRETRNPAAASPLLSTPRTSVNGQSCSCMATDASPSAPGGITVIYKDLIADEQRTRQIIADAATALSQGRNCLILTNWTAHLDKLADALRAMGHDPVVLRGGIGAKARAAALARLQPQPGGPLLLAVALTSAQARTRPMRWRFLSTDPGSTVKCTCPSSSTATTRTTAWAWRLPATSITPGRIRPGSRASPSMASTAYVGSP